MPARTALLLTLLAAAATVTAPVPSTGSPALAPAAPAARPRTHPASVEPGVYQVDRASRFDVKTKASGVLARLGADHLVRARAFEGTAFYDAAAPQQSRVEVTVLVDSLEVLSGPNPNSRREITKSMRNKVLHPDKFATIQFASRSVTLSDTALLVAGDLTLVGSTRPVTVALALATSGDTLRARGRFSVRQTDFGITPYRGPLGAVKVADEITFDFDAVAVRKP